MRPSWMQHFLPALFLVLALPVRASNEQKEFDNTLRGSPEVSCNRGSISLSIQAEHGAPSVVFAKGHFGKDGCSFRNETHVTFDFEKCNIRRKREVNPRGMAYTMTVVVQLHPLFITKVDRAYAVRCFYMEAEKSVGAALGVSELTTAVLAEDYEQPQCLYTLHRESPNGPLLKYAHVGDVVYHVWECASDVYGMLVHSCIVQDGQGHEHQVVDEDGCSLDPYLIKDLVYSSDLTRTFTESNAFNFPDDASVQFSCQIKMCMKGTGTCDGITPPRCGSQSSLGPSEFDKEQLLTEGPETASDPVFGAVHDDLTKSRTEGVEKASSSAPSTSFSSDGTTVWLESARTTAGSSHATSTSAAPSTSTASQAATVNSTKPFPTPKGIREFIREKYSGSVEGSGLEEEFDEREKIRDIRRRDTDTVDIDISSPELTILDKELGGVDDASSAAAALSTASEAESGRGNAPLVSDGICVPMTAFWLLVGLVLLSLSFVLVAVCKGHAKQGFVQF